MTRTRFALWALALMLTSITLPDVLAQEATTDTSGGLHTATFATAKGTIKVNLPDDMAAGDTISGTVFAEPAGKDAKERAQNEGELNGYVVEVEKQKLHPSGNAFRWMVPAGLATSAAVLTLRDSRGRELGHSAVPILPEQPRMPRQVPTAGDYELPTMGQAGRPIAITGPFDGNSANTSVKVGGQDAHMLAESPRKAVVQSPADVVGPATLQLNERGVSATGDYRGVALRLSAGKTALRKGEQTTLTVSVEGLQGVQESVTAHITNGSAEVVRMQGGEMQQLVVTPQEARGSNTVTREFTLVGVRPGTFNIRADLQPPGGEEMSDGEGFNEMRQADMATWNDMFQVYHQVQSSRTPMIASSLRKKFLKWWLDYLEAMAAYEMIDGWITSPFHYPLAEADVRIQVRNQIGALTEGAKKKLIDRLKKRAKDLRDKAKAQRAKGENDKAQMSEDQANAMDQAADEVQKSITPPPAPTPPEGEVRP